MGAATKPIRISLAEWRAFQKEFSSFRFEAVVGRAAMGVPRWFVHSGRGGAVPSAYFLRRIGHDPASQPVTGWIESNPNKFTRSVNSLQMVVILRHKKFWLILLKEKNKNTKVLCFLFAQVVILMRTCEEAMSVAFSILTDGLEQFSYRWVPMG